MCLQQHTIMIDPWKHRHNIQTFNMYFRNVIARNGWKSCTLLHDLFINLYPFRIFHIYKHRLLIVLYDCIIRQNAKNGSVLQQRIMIETKHFARCLIISSQISFVTYDRNGEIARQFNLSLSLDQTINFFPVLSRYRTTSRIHRCSFPPYTRTQIHTPVPIH